MTVSSCCGVRYSGRAGCMRPQFWPFCLRSPVLQASRAAKWSEVDDPSVAPGASDGAALCGGWADWPSRPHGHPSLDACSRSADGIGALHVSVSTQESLDQNVARLVELGIIVSEVPVAWLDPAEHPAGTGTTGAGAAARCACRSGQPNRGLARRGGRGPLPSGGATGAVRSFGARGGGCY